MRIVISFLLLLLIVGLIPLAGIFAQDTSVYVEAYDKSNLRSGPGTEYELIGEILAGTEYKVIAQHELANWLLIEVPTLPTRAGWVFKDVVQIKRGDLATVPYQSSFEELPVLGAAAPAVTPTIATDQNTSLIAPPVAASATPTLTPTVELPPTLAVLVTATLTGRSNIRYGPGPEYPIIATLDGGAIMTVTARHSNFPWLKVAVEGAPNGEGWVSESVVTVQGDKFALPVITDMAIAFPTPTSTPDTVVSLASPWENFGASDSSELVSGLGLPMHNYLLSQGFAPRTDKEASIFVMDLESGQHFTLNGGVAYSGMSITKIPVLVTYFVELDVPLQTEQAALVATTMICSENITTNDMIGAIGDGDPMQGAARITNTLRALGLGNSFLMSPYDTGSPNATPIPPVASVTTNADQVRTQPDSVNQLTVEEIGWLMGSMYQCAADGTGALIETFPERINQNECRQMLRVMSGNKIGKLVEASVQPGANVAHKHGWIDDTVGDAAMVISPDSRYVFVGISHERGGIYGGTSFPVLEEVARLTWNYFNPTAQLTALNYTTVPETCNIYGEPVIQEMLAGVWAGE